MNGDFAVALLAVLITCTGIFFDHRSRGREIRRVADEKKRDEAREARNKGRDERRTRENAELEARRHRHTLQLQATERLADWARRGVHALALADHMLHCTLSKSENTHSAKDRIILASQISALVDEGRWLFRNHHPDTYGKDKANLNKGLRDNRLDALVAAYKKLLTEAAIEPMHLRKDFAYKIQELSIPLSEQVLKETT